MTLEAQTTTVMGREVRVPVQIRDVSAFSATFVVPRAAVQRLIGAHAPEPVSLWGSSTCVSIAALDYRDGDWGSYRELAVVFPIVPPRPSTARVGLYMHYLPVTEAFTCEAGLRVYGFPKWVAQIDIEAGAPAHTCVLRSEGRHVLSLKARAKPRFSFGPASIDAYSVRHGALRRCRFTMQGRGLGARIGGATLELGDHPIANELRSLGLPRRALLTTQIASMRAEFGAPELVPARPTQ